MHKEKSYINIIPKSEVKYVIIAICTYKRVVELERLLTNLLMLNYPKNIKTEILVIDNDLSKSAERIVKNYNNLLNIEYFTEKNKGLSNVRNKALHVAISKKATHLAFIDDDEIADKNWLINHIEFYDNFENIYISSGPTYKRFDKNYPDYIVNNKIFKTISRKELGKYKKTCASGNVFFPLDIVQKNNIYFNEKYNFSGSEDTDFFSRLSEVGYNIGWNYNAVNFEIVCSERANIQYILKRAFHNGHSVSKVKFLNNKTRHRKYFYITEKIVTVFFNLIIVILIIPFGLTKTVNAITRAVNNFGKLLGALNPERKFDFYGK